MVKGQGKMERFLPGYDRHFEDPVGVAENGEALFRTHDGGRRWARMTRPTEAEKALGKEKLPQELGPAWCPSCDSVFSRASGYLSIQEHGICEACWLFDRGMISSIQCHRLPTVEEVLEIPPNDLRPKENYVLRQELLRLRAARGVSRPSCR